MESELIDQTNRPKKHSKLAMTLILIFIVELFIGRFFKLMHWPFAGILITTGAGGVIGGFLASLHVTKSSIRKLITIGMVIALCLFLYLQGFNYFSLIFIIPSAIIIYLVLYFHQSRRKKYTS